MQDVLIIEDPQGVSSYEDYAKDHLRIHPDDKFLTAEVPVVTHSSVSMNVAVSSDRITFSLPSNPLTENQLNVLIKKTSNIGWVNSSGGNIDICLFVTYYGAAPVKVKSIARSGPGVKTYAIPFLNLDDLDRTQTQPYTVFISGLDPLTNGPDNLGISFFDPAITANNDQDWSVEWDDVTPYGIRDWGDFAETTTDPFGIRKLHLTGKEDPANAPDKFKVATNAIPQGMLYSPAYALDLDLSDNAQIDQTSSTPEVTIDCTEISRLYIHFTQHTTLADIDHVNIKVINNSADHHPVIIMAQSDDQALDISFDQGVTKYKLRITINNCYEVLGFLMDSYKFYTLNDPNPRVTTTRWAAVMDSTTPTDLVRLARVKMAQGQLESGMIYFHVAIGTYDAGDTARLHLRHSLDFDLSVYIKRTIGIARPEVQYKCQVSTDRETLDGGITRLLNNIEFSVTYYDGNTADQDQVFDIGMYVNSTIMTANCIWDLESDNPDIRKVLYFDFPTYYMPDVVVPGTNFIPCRTFNWSEFYDINHNTKKTDLATFLNGTTLASIEQVVEQEPVYGVNHMFYVNADRHDVPSPGDWELLITLQSDPSKEWHLTNTDHNLVIVAPSGLVTRLIEADENVSTKTGHYFLDVLKNYFKYNNLPIAVDALNLKAVTNPQNLMADTAVSFRYVVNNYTLFNDVKQINDQITILMSKGNGLFRGSYPDLASMPTEFPNYGTPQQDDWQLNDFITVVNDSSHGGASTRYTLIDVGTPAGSALTWTYDFTYTTLGKIDLIAPFTTGHIPLIDTIGGLHDGIDPATLATQNDVTILDGRITMEHNRISQEILDRVGADNVLDDKISRIRGLYRGTYELISNLPTTITAFDPAPRLGDWALVKLNPNGYTAVYEITSINTATGAVAWTLRYEWPLARITPQLLYFWEPGDGHGDTGLPNGLPNSGNAAFRANGYIQIYGQGYMRYLTASRLWTTRGTSYNDPGTGAAGVITIRVLPAIHAPLVERVVFADGTTDGRNNTPDWRRVYGAHYPATTITVEGEPIPGHSPGPGGAVKGRLSYNTSYLDSVTDHNFQGSWFASGYL